MSAERCQRADLHVPTLDALKAAVERALATQFSSVQATVTKCPDLRVHGMAAPGLGKCGAGVIADVGGVPYMNDPDYHDAEFNLGQVRDTCAEGGKLNDPVFVMGAAGCNVDNCVVKGCNVNGEMVANAIIPGPDSTAEGTDESWWSGLDPADDSSITVGRHKTAQSRALKTGPLANLYLCDGSTDDVLYVVVKQRSGDQGDVFQTVRQALVEMDGIGGGTQVGLGCVGVVHRGKVDIHVMRDFFDEEMIQGTALCNSFCKHFIKDAAHTRLTMVSTIVSNDPKNSAMTLRLIHTHLFGKGAESSSDVCGHYHFDVSPDEISYELFLQPAKRIFRINNAHEHVAAEKGKDHVIRLLGKDVWAPAT